jgi:TPR repeat protein
MPRVELRALKDRAAQGDGEASFKLWAYYSFSVESDARLARRYYDRSIELEYPAALYDKAFWEWCREPVPHIDRVERLLRRAISLGFKDEKHLLEEVLEAKKSGVIPSRSPFRLFPGKPEPNQTPHPTPL